MSPGRCPVHGVLERRRESVMNDQPMVPNPKQVRSRRAMRLRSAREVLDLQSIRTASVLQKTVESEGYSSEPKRA
jgi:hypothetical protein